ncbi:hypothetical protein V6Z12_D11G042600 [Gossypium hirsutum]
MQASKQKKIKLTLIHWRIGVDCQEYVVNGFVGVFESGKNETALVTRPHYSIAFHNSKYFSIPCTMGSLRPHHHPNLKEKKKHKWVFNNHFFSYQISNWLIVKTCNLKFHLNSLEFYF